jgi:hypothetical protein
MLGGTKNARSRRCWGDATPLEQNACSVVLPANPHTGQVNSTKRYLPVCVATRRESMNAPFVGDEDQMNTTRLIAIALIVAGTLGLVYGGFSYTKDTTAVKLGPIELSVKEKKQVNVPMWAGIGAIVIGGLLLVLGNKRG